MSTSAIGGPRADRMGRPMRWAKPHVACGMLLQAKRRSRTMLEVAAIAAVLVLLIMIDGIGLRLLLWLMQGVPH